MGARGCQEARRRVPLPERRDWGEKRALRPPRGCASRPGSLARANRLRHLLTIWRGVSSRAAMTSLGRPSSARRMILARITSQYGDVYLLATAASACRSSLESPIVNGLFLGIRDTAPLMQAYQITSRIGLRNTSSYLRIDVLSKLREIFRASRSQPVGGVIEKINPILRGG